MLDLLTVQVPLERIAIIGGWRLVLLRSRILSVALDAAFVRVAGSSPGEWGEASHVGTLGPGIYHIRATADQTVTAIATKNGNLSRFFGNARLEAFR